MGDANVFVSCPYNPAHRIRKYKLMNHISKCKKTASEVEKKVECPLDKSHIVDRNRLREHIEMCSSIGKAADMDIGHIQPRDVDHPIAGSSYNSTENWEDDPEVPHYDPMKVSAEKPVIRCISGLTKLEKKQFKNNERMRIANLKGVHTANVTLESMRETVQEAPLRPPRNATVSLESTTASQVTATSTSVLQNDFDNDLKIHEDEKRDYDDNASAHANFVPKFHNSSFHKMLYAELAPEDNDIKQLEQSLSNTSISDGNQEKKRTEVKTTEIDTTSKLFNVDNMNKKKDECIANTSSVSNDIDTLLALKNESSTKKVQPVDDTMKADQINQEFGVKGPILDKIFNQFTERLAYLNEIQNTAAEEGARLSQQLKELKKLREQIVSRK